MQRAVKGIIALLLLLLLAGVGYLAKKSREAPVAGPEIEEKVPVTAVRISAGSFVDRGEYAGRLAALQDVTVVAEAGGKVVEDAIDEGDQVAAGQVLYRLEDDALRFSVRRAEAALDLARQNFLKAQDASRPELISRLEALAEESAAALTKAENDAARFNKLYEEGAVSLGQKENIDLALAAARSRTRVAAENLSEARTGARHEDQAAAEAAVRQAEAALLLARDALGKTVIESPFKGVVASKTVFAGDTVRPGLPLAEVVDISDFKITIGVSTADVGHFRRGDRVQVEIRPSGDSREGVVRDVGIKADERSGSFPVIIELPNDGTTALRAGMDLVVRFIREEARDVIVVPRSALIEERTGFLVFVADGNRARQRQVSIGPLSESEAVITTGLEAGELLVVVGQQRLREGDLLELSIEE